MKEIDTGNNTKEWTFNLTASDLTYKRPGGWFNKWTARNDKLEELTISFHLYVTSGEKTKSNVPNWKVEISEKGNGNYNIESSEYQETRAYKGEAIDASFKYDNLIDGWDFDESNDDPCLLWGTQVLFANAVSDEVAGWIKTQFDETQEEVQSDDALTNDAFMTYETPGGQSKTLSEEDASDDIGDLGVDYEDGIYSGDKPELIQKNKLSLEDNWQKVGSLTWVTDVDVDGRIENMYFQVYGARKFAAVDWDMGAVKGFIATGGFSYPGGDKIFHDPTYSSEVFQLTGSNDDGSANGARIVALLLFLLVVGIVAVVVVVFFVKVASGGKATSDKRMDNGGENKSTDEEDYYDSYYMDKKRKR